jgi:hypothetical protein
VVLYDERGPQLIAKMIGVGYGLVSRWNEMEAGTRLVAEEDGHGGEEGRFWDYRIGEYTGKEVAHSNGKCKAGFGRRRPRAYRSSRFFQHFQ